MSTVHENYPEIEESVMTHLRDRDRDSISIKQGNWIFHENGYSDQIYSEGQKERSIGVGIAILILVTIIIITFLFWQYVPFINRNHIFSTQALIWIGLAFIVIILSGIAIGEAISGGNIQRRYIFVGEVTGTIAHEHGNHQQAEKFLKAALELEHTNNDYELLEKNGYSYRDFKYEASTVIVILSGMVAVAPLALYFTVLYFYLQRRTYVDASETNSI